MRIALIGYGKMGRTIERMGREQGYTFPLIIDLENLEDLNSERLSEADVAIEFTTPASAPGNIITCLESGIPVVAGTTGWSEQAGKVFEICRKQEGTLFTASNFSIGVNILFSLNRKLAGIMAGFPQYLPSIREVHHIQKLDAPSGTALSLAGQIMEENARITGWSLDPGDDPAILPIEAVREGDVKGIHTIAYESEADILTLGHKAKSREAFAAGALLAAGFIRDKKGIFTMKDLLNL